MTDDGVTAEHHLNFEREDPKEPETTKLKFWIDGRLAALKGVIEGLKSERGPDDYEDRDRELKNLLFEAVKFGSQNSRRFNNGDEQDSNGIKKWVAGVGAVLVASGIISGITISNQVATQGAKIDYIIEVQREQNARITRIEQQNARP